MRVTSTYNPYRQLGGSNSPFYVNLANGETYSQVGNMRISMSDGDISSKVGDTWIGPADYDSSDSGGGGDTVDIDWGAIGAKIKAGVKRFVGLFRG